MKVRPTTHGDIASLQEVLDATELFPSEALPEMASGISSGDDSADLWLTCEVHSRAIGFCYAAAEPMTDGAWNMHALAVLPSLHGKGYGGAIVARLEAELRRRNQRILIADTSGAKAFARTRNFYRKSGYREVARIPDFWAAGDDKIVFWKPLA